MFKNKQPRQTLRGIYRKLFRTKGEPWAQIALSKAERKGLSPEEIAAKRQAKWLTQHLEKSGQFVPGPIGKEHLPEVVLSDEDRMQYMEGKEELQMLDEKGGDTEEAVPNAAE